MRCYVLMGVSGCGKSSIGTALSAVCQMTFLDGDDLHPPANISKMASGVPLADDDRAPWLDKVGQRLADHAGPIVVGCSALKRGYRDRIRKQVPEPVHFLHLDAPRDVLWSRVSSRPGHFMPPALLDSQFEALEPLGTGEWGDKIDISRPFSEVVSRSEAYVKGTLL